ncbi:biopolymer transporter ExbD [Cyanobacterium aponinum UTEX 3222]|uniref:Biopolymer transporter ExbD n=2 Tax=Cyanobacterium aponinum TaxID=379064 RepID=A0A844GWE6_9CHRO|nr:biopolymer transporter ExbD [Cyanobacterium aponinum]WRL42174.1 biopolymer transporter ExbD [Cyanobacterium aponinum UTEX 3222]MBD2394588.1 biopolymer transporter ExbD [Cyanobacterium aponinum FACHB-4101]MTF40490.1 biopolymer transporter ExbD [Cyanobacterium aponinum 0216]PHV62060.1 biopolymer transporter ExbD [Cyanobacterium aponinum IPPAS B-1201]WPF89201.1 biopolymer transporter ExbD [Cyanobacterium aponinum AL20115]
MRIPDEQDVQGEINIVPMIDAIFSILAFFIVSSISLIRSEGLPVNLPSAKTTESQKVAQINVTIQPDGKVFLNKQPIEVNGLQGAVTKLIPNSEQGMVIINADEKVSHGIVVSVMDELRQIKGVGLAISAKKK